MSAVWTSISGIICSAMLQVANKRYPDFYLLPVYVCWGLSGLMIIAIFIVPESPWYHARRGNKEAAMNSMRKLYGNIEGYDLEEEYGIILRTLEHEKWELEHANATQYKDIFLGRNRLRTTIVTVLFTAQLLGGLAMISTYSTCETCSPSLGSLSDFIFSDFFSIAGLNDPFLGSLILSCVHLKSYIVDLRHPKSMNVQMRQPGYYTRFHFDSGQDWKTATGDLVLYFHVGLSLAHWSTVLCLGKICKDCSGKCIFSRKTQVLMCGQTPSASFNLHLERCFYCCVEHLLALCCRITICAA